MTQDEVFISHEAAGDRRDIREPFQDRPSGHAALFWAGCPSGYAVGATIDAESSRQNLGRANPIQSLRGLAERGVSIENSTLERMPRSRHVSWNSRSAPEKVKSRLNCHGATGFFGLETLADSLPVFRSGGNFMNCMEITMVPDLGYKVDETWRYFAESRLARFRVSVECSPADNDLSSNRRFADRQRSISPAPKFRFTREVGGSYLLVVPGALARPKAYDDMDSSVPPELWTVR